MKEKKQKRGDPSTLALLQQALTNEVNKILLLSQEPTPLGRTDSEALNSYMRTLIIYEKEQRMAKKEDSLAEMTTEELEELLKASGAEELLRSKKDQDAIDRAEARGELGDDDF